MAGGRRGGRQPSPCTRAGEEREDGEDPPPLTLDAGEEGQKVNLMTFLFIPQGAIKGAAVQVNMRITSNEELSVISTET